MEEYTITNANKFINNHLHQVKTQYRPQVHFVAPIGWINDPNGMVFFKGEYHLFYQHYPYGPYWGPMHWGHAKSKDLVNWEHLPVALAPDQPYDKNGCFSGSAIVKDDTLWLMYTGNIDNGDGTGQQVQNMAFSKDGIHFEKLASNPVMTGQDLPDEIISADFRDPKIFEREGHFYAVVAARHRDNVGCVVLVSSENLIDWKFESIFLKGKEHQGFMWECPDYFVLDGHDTLLMSPMRYQREDLSYHNINSTVVVRGKVDWDRKVFEAEFFEELDHGHDFYAPQTLEDDRGRRIVIAWAHTWGRTNVTQDLNYEWALSMTFPRVLNWQGDKLVQRPVVHPLLKPVSSPLIVNNASMVKVNDFEAGNDYTFEFGQSDDKIILHYKAGENTVYIDRSQQTLEIKGEEMDPVIIRGVRVKEDRLEELELIIDTNSIEVFVNGGTAVLSSNVYLQENTLRELRLIGPNFKIQVGDY